MATEAKIAAKTAAKKTVRKARKTAKRTARTAVKTTAAAAKKNIDTATRIATADTMGQAARQYTEFFKQSPFKMENMMNTQSFPQLDNMQNQMQSAANQATAYISKASAAAEKSQTRLAAGMQECGQTLASLAQANLQRANEAMRALASCRTLNEYADVQTRLVKQYTDAMTTETSRFVEQATKCVTAAAEPLNDLAAEGMSTIKKSMAA